MITRFGPTDRCLVGCFRGGKLRRHMVFHMDRRGPQPKAWAIGARRNGTVASAAGAENCKT